MRRRDSASRQADDARQRARRAHERHVPLAAERVLAFQHHHEVQALVEDARERMRRVEPERREHRQTFVAEIARAARASALTFHVSRREKRMPSLSSAGIRSRAESVLRRDQRLRAIATRASTSLAATAVGPKRAGLRACVPSGTATRTSKNSSRLVLEMQMKRNRSRRGTAGSAACASTRSLNPRMPSSRFEKRIAVWTSARRMKCRKRAERTLGNSHSMMTVDEMTFVVILRFCQCRKYYADVGR